jgi:hypothetical protein
MPRFGNHVDDTFLCLLSSRVNEYVVRLRPGPLPVSICVPFYFYFHFPLSFGLHRTRTRRLVLPQSDIVTVARLALSQIFEREIRTGPGFSVLSLSPVQFTWSCTPKEELSPVMSLLKYVMAPIVCDRFTLSMLFFSG